MTKLRRQRRRGASYIVSVVMIPEIAPAAGPMSGRAGPLSAANDQHSRWRPNVNRGLLMQKRLVVELHIVNGGRYGEDPDALASEGESECISHGSVDVEVNGRY